MIHRRFLLTRDRDVSGFSGTGPVAEGVQFSDGTVVLRWLTTKGTRQGVLPTTVLHDNVGSVVTLHGHDGASTVRWLDPPPGRTHRVDQTGQGQ